MTIGIVSTRASVLSGGIDYARRYGLIASWALDEASGTMIDSVGTNNLTAVNNPLAGAAKVGAASRQFVAASSQYGSIADNAALSIGNVDAWGTLWINLDSKPSAVSIMAKLNGNGADAEYGLVYTGGATDRFGLKVCGSVATAWQTTVSANTFGAPTIGAWCCLCWYHRFGVEIGLSVNGGAFDVAAHTTGIRDSTNPFVVGSYATGAGDFMNGRIDAVRFGKSPPLGIAVLSTEIRDYYYNGGNGR